MIKTEEVSVSIYKFGTKLKVIAQFGLDGLSIDEGSTGKMEESKRQALQKALEDALSKWEFSNG